MTAWEGSLPEELQGMVDEHGLAFLLDHLGLDGEANKFIAMKSRLAAYENLRAAVEKIASGERVMEPTGQRESAYAEGTEGAAVYMRQLTPQEIARAALDRLDQGQP